MKLIKPIPLLLALAVLLTTPAMRSAAQVASGQQPGVLMNFQDADIRHIIDFMQEATGRIIIVDSTVKGSITIASDRMLPLDEAMEVLNAALNAKGFTMVESKNMIRIIPLDRSKSTDVPTRIGADYSALAETQEIVTQVVPLTHLDADKLRADLKALVSEHGEILFNEAANTVIITDTSANVKRLLKIVNFLDQESPRRMQIRVFNLDYASARDMAELISKLPKSSGGATETESDTGIAATVAPPAGVAGGALEISGDLTVLADERSNSLVVATSPGNFPAVEQLVKSLDRMLSQVLIEVLIVEASLDTDTKLGMEWTLNKQRTSKGHTYSGSTSTDWDLGSEQFGMKTAILKDGANQLLHFLMENQERINILSTPMIVTSDNQEASITVGSEVPYLKETRRSTGDTRDYVYEYRDVGIKLTVTPHINDEKFVNMNIHQEIKKLGAETLFDAYIIITREADATVSVRDQQTVVLGGLMRDDETITRNSVPVLGDLPLVGKLFRYKRTEGEKTELLVFITPHVITSSEDIDRITREQQERMNSIIHDKVPDDDSDSASEDKPDED